MKKAEQALRAGTRRRLPPRTKMTDAPAHVRLARRIGHTAIGKAALARAYWGAAKAAAQVLARVPGVDGVYVSGSVRDAKRLRPGYSDIDLTLVVEVPTLEHELRLRSECRRILRRLNGAGPLFKHLDYVERRDLDVLRALGNTWALNLDSSWELLAGESRLERGVRASRDKLRLERLVVALRRWQDTSSFILSGGDGRAPQLNAIGAERTLVEVLSAWLELPRFTPLPSLLEGARSRSLTFHALRDLARDPARATTPRDSAGIRNHVVASLEALEAFARELASDWSDEWPRAALLTERAAASAMKPAGARDLAASYFGLDHYGADAVYVLPAPGTPARDAVASLERLLEAGKHGAVPDEPRPILLTEPLWCAAAALDSPPFTGADFALARRLRWGDVWPAPRRPAGQVWDDLVFGRAVQMLFRPRGHGLRVAISPDRALEKLRYEVCVRGRALATLLGVDVSDLAEPPTGRLNETVLLEKLRGLNRALRPIFATKLRSEGT